jgi:hypothetical protein
MNDGEAERVLPQLGAIWREAEIVRPKPEASAANEGEDAVNLLAPVLMTLFVGWFFIWHAIKGLRRPDTLTSRFDPSAPEFVRRSVPVLFWCQLFAGLIFLAWVWKLALGYDATDAFAR